MEVFIIGIVSLLILLTTWKIAYDQGYKDGLYSAFAQTKGHTHRHESGGETYDASHPDHYHDTNQ